MRTLLSLLLIVLFAGLFAVDAMAQPPANGHEYIGLNKCSMCHKGEKKGLMLEKWQEGPHAMAYETLGSEEAAAIAAEMGIENAQEADQCLRCHVTGHGEPAELTAALDLANGVSCESCHGAGAEYKSMKTMRDFDASVAAGMVAEPKTTCVACHNEDSPTYKPFNLEEYWAEIDHSKPEAEEE